MTTGNPWITNMYIKKAITETDSGASGCGLIRVRPGEMELTADIP